MIAILAKLKHRKKAMSMLTNSVLLCFSLSRQTYALVGRENKNKVQPHLAHCVGKRALEISHIVAEHHGGKTPKEVRISLCYCGVHTVLSRHIPVLLKVHAGEFSLGWSA